ncbi:16S rRNA (cytosine(1402)-N(4))-methyltransferase RsmH [Hwanghaeella grinnelliae]|uniref:Ribosomal RNA small subunit methyltransferase H n=1 Tax=Hwanghaeella grinnelliae TaxID=2500179 RepID=A0A437QJC9_9PROT|nr:16S rRNA (cytosine(1402)-N(4))-methyltransferase RsmH [Hwanghaeella grinnelliae]RVU34609.1 16S rRNA (cytosine(1402)-N(4))-methyltransferase RsmH [Hwanghaeella grinnelliae]
MTEQHIPVLLNEMIDALAPRDGGIYLDGTFGRGGYSRAILRAADCRVWAIDRDPSAIEQAQKVDAEFPGRFTILCGKFGDMEDLLAGAGVDSLDGVVLDIGVSSPQIDTAERGFSFRMPGPLDMRMGNEGPTAADIVNSWGEDELARLIRDFGEEHRARQVARAIVRARDIEPIATTTQLADIVRSVVRKAKDGLDPATRTFQALRIQVNDELGQLDRALAAAERLLRPDGRLVVVAFHSLEDKRVKAFLSARSGAKGISRHLPGPAPDAPKPTFTLAKRGTIKPSEAEMRANPRCRSSRLRVAVRTDAPAWAADRPKSVRGKRA